MNIIKENIIVDLDNIKKDIEEICSAINSSSLSKSTNNLTDLLISISNALKETLRKE